MDKITDSLVEKRRAKEKSDLWFWIMLAVMAGIFTIILALMQFVYVGVQVDGNSMLPTLNNGDVLVINTKKEVSKNSVVVIDGVKEYLLIKRVVAVEGDEVEFNEDGFVYINGQKYSDEFGCADYSNRVSAPFEKKVLGQGEYFFLGDNRSNSSDGRDYGTCTKEQITGVVATWSVNNPMVRLIYKNTVIKGD